MSIESVMPSNHLILCCPLLLPPSIFPSIRVFLSESVLGIRWPKYWSFSFNISPPHEYSGLICFKVDWLDLLAVQGTLRSFLQHHSSISHLGINISTWILGGGDMCIQITAWTKTFLHSFSTWSFSWPGFPWQSRHPSPPLSPFTTRNRRWLV